MSKPRRPGFVVLIAAYACAGLAGLILWAALQMPVAGVRFAPAGGGRVAVMTDDRLAVTLDADRQVVFIGPRGQISQQAGELVQDYVPDGRHADIAAWYATRTRLAAMVEAGDLALWTGLPGAGIALPVADRGVTDLPANLWMLLAGGTATFLIGAWVWALRPDEWAARMFGISGLGLLFASYSGALYDARELTADGTLLWAASGVNYLGSNIYGLALCGVFVCFPRPLVPPKTLIVLAPLALGWAMTGALGWVSMTVFYAGMLAHFTILVGLIGWQWRLAKDDPAGRAALRWIGLTTLAGAGVVTVSMAAPKLFGTGDLGSDGSAFLPLSLIYGGMALAVGRYRLFELDRWAYQVILAVAAAMALLILDAVLIFGLHLQASAALGAALIAIAALYLPGRSWLWRRIVGRYRPSPADLFQSAATVAMSPRESDRQTQWRALLTSLFDPLEIVAAEAGVSEPALAQEGLELLIPAAAGGGPLSLRYPRKGRALFNTADRKLAAELTRFMAGVEASRDAYARGASEERQRIAQDLHDDINASLLTSLHRTDVSAVRGDVRQAIRDIRVMISGLAGEETTIGKVLADLRHETHQRLDAGGVALDWPLNDAFDLEIPVAYAVYKNLISAHRETITNVLRHARASMVTVMCDVTDGGLEIVVQDDGAGPRGKGQGNGLRNIGLRLAKIGGTVAAGAGEVAGYRVMLRLPLPVAA